MNINPHQIEHLIGYAYPTSPAAKTHGHVLNGCWLIEVQGKEWAELTYAEALAAVKKQGTVPSRWSRDHPINIKSLGQPCL